jgi:hypothetical protein
VIAVITDEKDFATFRGTLRGKFVLGTAMRDVPAHFEAQGHRYTDAELADLSKQPEASGRGGRGGNFLAFQDFNKKKTQFWIDEGVAAVLDISRGDGGTLFVQGGGSRDPKDPPSPPQVVVAAEQYGRIVRTLEKKSRSRCRLTPTTGFSTPISPRSTSSPSCLAPTRPTRS